MPVFGYGSKADYEKGLYYTTWTWWPTDTLDALDLLLVYLGASPKLVRPKIVTTFRKDSRNTATMHRALHDKAIRSATAIVHPGKRMPDRRGLCWYITSSMDLKGRMATAGIDINTMLVNDERRWAFTWQQVTTGNVITYSGPENEKLYNSDYPTPPVDPVVKHVTVSFTPGQPTKVKYDFNKTNNYVWHNHKRVYHPRAAQAKAEARNKEGPQL